MSNLHVRCSGRFACFHARVALHCLCLPRSSKHCVTSVVVYGSHVVVSLFHVFGTVQANVVILHLVFIVFTRGLCYIIVVVHPCATVCVTFVVFKGCKRELRYSIVWSFRLSDSCVTVIAITVFQVDVALRVVFFSVNKRAWRYNHFLYMFQPRVRVPLRCSIVFKRQWCCATLSYVLGCCRDASFAFAYLKRKLRYIVPRFVQAKVVLQHLRLHFTASL